MAVSSDDAWTCSGQNKQLGKIRKLKIGHCSRDDMFLGITFELGGEGWGIGDNWSYNRSEWSEHCKWTEADRILALGEIFMKINDLLIKAKVNNVEELKDIPVEVTTEGGRLKSWRILEEVL